MSTRRATATALAAATLLALTGCSSDDAGDAPPAGQSEQAQEGQPTDSEEARDTTALGDLVPGDAHDWGDGITTTITSAHEIGPTDLPEGYTVDDGLTAFWINMTLVNDSDAPLDLSDIGTRVEGTTTGGSATPAWVPDVSASLQGELAPGHQMEHREIYAMDLDRYGRDIAITINRWQLAEHEPPVWRGTINPPA
ncbi:hypothetical protein [Streptomyces sp. NBRC 109706]|uniref:hypothetical protein n=1 Tax=Streptomyces sp. NBRC 109706 TaxID=1550035 RepID=UPI00131B13F5|nr:hypothetical protein [Streptomyces sp. NBRC 109706]